MQTQIKRADEAALREAAQILNRGGVVGFPTETVYGLGGNALDPGAARKIFEAKGRPGDNPLIVHVRALEEIPALIRGPLPRAAQRLAEAFWPGPLTLILPKAETVPREVTGGLDTVAIRMPSHPVARRLIELSGLPIAAPSANRSGRPSPTQAAHVLEDMDGRIPLILDGGPCSVGLESTVVDLSEVSPRVLRPGGITPGMIKGVLGSVQVDASVLSPVVPGQAVRSPGMKYRHYAPKGQLTIVRGAPEAVARRIRELCGGEMRAGRSVCVLAPLPHAARYEGLPVRPLGQDGSLAGVAAELFAALREMDDRGVECIFSEAVPAEELGLAVMNRMGRAAAFHLVEVEE